MVMDTSQTIYGFSKPRLQSPKLQLPSAGQVVTNLAREFGVPLLPWQEYVIDDALQITPEGKWAKSNIGVLVARQNGKTALMRQVFLAHLYVFGSKQIIAMAQTRQLALDTFKQTVDLAESLDWTRKRIKRVSRTNGQEELEVYCHHYPKSCTEKCQRIRKYSIRAATSEGSRGSTANLLYVDELREISEEAWQAAVPLTRTTGGQTWITSNAGSEASTVLNSLRTRALMNNSPRMGWYEWSAAEGSQVNPPDIRAIQQANPALGHLIDVDSILDSAKFDTKEAFMTESLCMWVSSMSSPWNMEKWNNGEREITMQDGLVTYMGLDLSFNREKAFLVSVQITPEEDLAVFVHEWHKDGGINDIALASEIAELARRFNPRIVAYDPNTAGFIAPHLARAQVATAPTPWSSANFAIACDQTLNALNNEKIIHAGQEVMHEHLVACARRPAGDGGWRIARRAATSPISAAVALVMAIGHATTPQPESVIISV
jgi:phage terminase large subunit-like protein